MVLFFSLMGCTKQCFLSKDDFDNAQSPILPAHLESDTTLGITPVTGLVASPATVNLADRPPRHMTLQEAIAISLESGTVSERNGPGGTGLVNDSLFTFTGGSLNQQSDRIRVLAMNPAISAAGIEQSLARFDAQFVSGFNTASTDELFQGLNSFTNGTNASFFSSIVKGIPSGGVASVSFQGDYRMLTRPPNQGINSVINPQYTTRFSLGFEQPLWRDFGTDINQLVARFPSIIGSAMPSAAAAAFNNKLLPLNQSSQLSNNSFFTDGILIARIRFDSQRAEFERNVNSLVLNTEVAYWKLYQAYGNLYSYEEVMRIAHKVWMNYKAKYDAGQKGLADLAPIRAQYEEFRGERLKALGQVLEAERNLRGILGLPIEDGSRIVPVTSPTMAPFQPNWEAAVKDALALRPELVIARENLRLSQLNLITQKNFLKPDLRFTANYSPVGFGTNLSGGGTYLDGNGESRPNNAFQSLTTDHFNNWNMGLVFNMPLGFRLEHAAVRAAKLNLAQSYEVLKDQEERTKRILTLHYQKVFEWYNRIQITNAERKAYGEAVNVRYQELAVGKTTVADFLLDVQRRLALAFTKEYEAITEYNNTLARFEWAKGTLLPFNNVSISEGALPECVQVRAVENERQRTNALILRERPAPATHPARLVGDLNGPPQTILEQPPQPLSADFLNSPLSKETFNKNAAGVPTNTTIDTPAKTQSFRLNPDTSDRSRSDVAPAPLSPSIPPTPAVRPGPLTPGTLPPPDSTVPSVSDLLPAPTITPNRR